ncbi:MAG: CPBP family intramembrane metalloprotease [Chloroflexi bacterium]|nr:CPBP family intramembrane metalloprotease [Chloroflexota bacterium]
MTEAPRKPVASSNRLIEFLIPQGEISFFPLAYLQLLAVAEGLTTLRDPFTGLVAHGITLLLLLIHGGLTDNIRDRRILLGLALAPLIRLLSLSLPLAGKPLVEWYFYIGGIVYVAFFIAARLFGFSGYRLGLTLKNWQGQVLIGLSGIGLGFIEYLILKPEPLVPEFYLPALIAPALVLTIFTGLLEELVFRGLIQQVALASYGRFGVNFSALLFAILHIGYGSIPDFIFVYVVALLFGLIVLKTDSLVGVTIAHSLNNVFLLIVFPLSFGN